MQAEAQLRVVQAAVAWHQRGRAPSARTAFRELLQGRGGYATATAQTTLAPYDHGRLSIPDDVRESPSVVSMLPGLDAEVLVGYQEWMLRDPADVRRIAEEYGEAGRHVDPQLQRQRRTYTAFVRRLADIVVEKAT